MRCLSRDSSKDYVVLASNTTCASSGCLIGRTGILSPSTPPFAASWYMVSMTLGFTESIDPGGM